MDVLILLLLAYNGNLQYNNFIFLLSFFLFNNQANIYRNNLYTPYYNKSNFSSNNISTKNNINKESNMNISNNRDIQSDDTPSYSVAITDFENIDYQSDNPEKTQLKDIDFTSPSQKNSSKSTTRNNNSTSRTKKTSFEKNNPTTPPSSTTSPSSKTATSKTTASKGNQTYNKNTHTHKTNSNTTTKSWSSPTFGKNYKGTCTIVSNDGTFTGKIIGDLNNLITLKLDDDQVVYINKNSIISFY